jgi:uncharacterized metal-binding protein
MPSGRTHDSITLWSLPLIAGVTFDRTQNAGLTLLLSGGYLFSGLMFGPDLDVYSQQYKRWGILRWIWLPYRQSMRHRSFLSHGMILGTAIRVLYLMTWGAAALGVGVLVSAIAYFLAGELALWQQGFGQSWQWGMSGLGRSLQVNASEWLALLLGLELGALSHSMSDWIGSRYKRLAPRKAKPATTQASKPKAGASGASVPPTPPSRSGEASTVNVAAKGKSQQSAQPTSSPSPPQSPSSIPHPPTATTQPPIAKAHRIELPPLPRDS